MALGVGRCHVVAHEDRRPRRPWCDEAGAQLRRRRRVHVVGLDEPPLAGHLLGLDREDRVAALGDLGPCHVIELHHGVVEHAPQPRVVRPPHRRRRHGRRRELDGDGLAVRALEWSQEGPRRVHVGGQQHGSAAGPPTIGDPPGDPLALGGVAVPLVVVHDAPVEDGVAVGEQAVGRAQGPWPRQIDRVDDDAVGDDRPRPRPVGKALPEPAPLRLPEQRTIGGVERWCAVAAGLQVAPHESGVEEHQLGQVADPDGPPDHLRVGRVAEPGRDPLLARRSRGGDPHRPRTVATGIVALGPFPPGVVGEVVIVPDGDHRVAEVQRLQVGVGAQLGEPSPVVVLRHRGVRRVVVAGAVVAVVLVEVVAEVQDEVDLSLGQRPVHAEGRDRVVGAGNRPDAERVHRSGGERAGPADRRVLAAGREAVPVGRRRRQPADLDHDGVIPVRRRGGRPGGDDLGQVGVGGDQPVGVGLVGAEPGPQQDARRRRLEGGDRVGEDRRSFDGACLRRRHASPSPGDTTAGSAAAAGTAASRPRAGPVDRGWRTPLPG